MPDAPLQSPPDLGHLIKAYDIRGVVPDELDEPLARRIGSAFAEVVVRGTSPDRLLRADRPAAADRVVVGYDMRPSSPGLVAAFADGVTAQGVDVVRIGLCSTDALYYASGSMGIPGAMFTASHNPARYNGIKLCRAGATPVGQDTGLREIRTLLESGTAPEPAGRPGRISDTDILDAYAAHLRKLAPLDGIRPLRVVVDAGNGMGGLTVPVVFDGLPLAVTPLYFELDGTFPNHEANPIDPATMVDLQAAVIAHGADLGLALDGDADRCFVVDERGELVSPSTITALIAARELAREPGATVIHNLITSRAVPEVILERGGHPVRTRVGHSFIKAVMAESGAVFGGEHSGHFYFRDFWRADSGLLAALHVLAALGETPEGVGLSALLAPFQRYVDSGEVNSRVPDPASVAVAVESVYAGLDGVSVDHLDGLTVATEGWWFNLRPSNTEPLLRLNVEADDRTTMERVRDEVLALIREEA